MPMPLQKNEQKTNKLIGLRIIADDLTIKGQWYFKDLGALFQELATQFSAKKLQQITDRHMLGMKIIEALPQ